MPQGSCHWFVPLTCMVCVVVAGVTVGGPWSVSQSILEYLERHRMVLYIDEFYTSQVGHCYCGTIGAALTGSAASSMPVCGVCVSVAAAAPGAFLLGLLYLRSGCALRLGQRCGAVCPLPSPEQKCFKCTGQLVKQSAREKMCPSADCNKRVVNRDLNASANLCLVFTSWLKGEPRPEHLRRPQRPASAVSTAGGTGGTKVPTRSPARANLKA